MISFPQKVEERKKSLMSSTVRTQDPVHSALKSTHNTLTLVGIVEPGFQVFKCPAVLIDRKRDTASHLPVVSLFSLSIVAILTVVEEVGWIFPALVYFVRYPYCNKVCWASLVLYGQLIPASLIGGQGWKPLLWKMKSTTNTLLIMD